jgi:drug/metabolite transporter (DMT)-like permease
MPGVLVAAASCAHVVVPQLDPVRRHWSGLVGGCSGERPDMDSKQRLGKAVMVPLWSSGFIAGALATAHAPALAMTFWRFVVAAPLMALIAIVTRAPWPRERRTIAAVVLVGVLLQVVQFTGIYLSLQYGVPAGLAALLAGSSPLLVALVSTTLLDEHLGRRQWIGSAIGVVGVLLAVADDLHGTATMKGLLFALLGLCGLVGGTLVQRRHGANADARAAVTIQLTVGAALLAVITALSQGFRVPITEPALAPIAWLVIGPSLTAILLFFWLLKREKGGEATSFLYLVPSVTAIAAVPILGQPLHAGAIAGLVLALIGTTMVSGGRAPATAGRAGAGVPHPARHR